MAFSIQLPNISITKKLMDSTMITSEFNAGFHPKYLEDKWTTVTSGYPKRCHHATLAVSNQYAVMIGGQEVTVDDTILDITFVDFVNGTWKTQGTLPFAMNNCSACMIPDTNKCLIFSDRCIEYDFSTGSYTEFGRPSDNSFISASGASHWRGSEYLVYYITYNEGSAYYDHHLAVWDNDRKVYSQYIYNPSYGRSGGTGGIYMGSDNFMTISGWNGSNFTKHVLITFPYQEEYYRMNDFPEELAPWNQMALTEYNEVFAFGGYLGDMAVSNHVYSYKESSDSWERRADLPISVSEGSATRLKDGRLILLGGRFDPVTFYRDIYIYG